MNSPRRKISSQKGYLYRKIDPTFAGKKTIIKFLFNKQESGEI